MRTVTVAAHDSSPQDKEAADYVCDGVWDHVEIQAAFEHSHEVKLLKGTYNLGKTVEEVPGEH